MNLFDELCDGFRLVGTFGKTGVFKPGVTIPSLTQEELVKNTKFLRPAILGRLKNFDDEDLQSTLYDTTLEEATVKGWLEGPYSPDEIHGLLGPDWLPVRRFGIMQKDKLRPIDNFKESSLNRTFGSVEKIELRAMEHVLWMSLVLMRFCRHLGEVAFTLSNGEVLEGSVHPAWNKVDFGLEATCVDMKSAYKQLPLHPDEYSRTVVSLWDVKHKAARCFLMRTLPFGATASVHHFLRVSNFIHAVGMYAGLCWGAYFDDFPILNHSVHVKSSMTTALGIFDLLGFRCSLDKLDEFGKVASMLGVEMNLSESKLGILRVQNKPSRVSEMTECLDMISQNRVIDADKLPSYLGKMQFAEAQLWGRAGRLALADLREATLHKAGKIQLTAEASEALSVLRNKFAAGKPKTLTATLPERPHLLFTDGALEYDDKGNPKATVGGVLVRRDGCVFAFGCNVPDEILRTWQVGGKTHVIGLVELYAAIAGLRTWCEFLSKDRVILFIDSWPAYDTLVKGTSGVKEWRKLLLSLESLDEEHEFLLWISRVPSSSNPSDPPSRGKLSDIFFLGDIHVVDMICPVFGKPVKSYEMK